MLTQIQAKKPEVQKSIANKQRVNEPQINQSNSQISQKKPVVKKQALKRNQPVLASSDQLPHPQVDKLAEQIAKPVVNPTEKTETESKNASKLIFAAEDNDVQGKNIVPEQSVTSAAVSKSVAPIIDAVANGHAKKNYLSTLLARIKHHKFYPQIARRRNMQGQVNVSFLLLSTGKLSRIEIDGGPKPLREATLKAINDALPLPAPPSTITFPMLVSFNMDYRLK